MNGIKNTRIADIYESVVPYEGLGFANLTIKSHFPLTDENLQNMTRKVSKMLSAYSDVLSNSPSKMNTYTMTVYTNSNGQDQVLLEEKN